MNKKTFDQIKKLELELLTLSARTSKKRLTELLANDFYEFAKDGKKYSKREIIKILPKCPEEKIVTSKFEIKEIAKDTALVSYVAAREVVKTKEKTRTLCSSIWQKRNDAWQMIFFQGTTAE